MRVISKVPLRDFWLIHPKAEGPLKAWYHEVKKADWNNPTDIKQKYGSASILKFGRVVFNICGGDYRIVTHIKCEFKVVYIRFVGTHKDYDKIDAETI